jgi:hypothetical protein
VPTPQEGPERDPAEVEPTTNSDGAPPDMERVVEAERAAAEVEAATERSDG